MELAYANFDECIQFCILPPCYITCGDYYENETANCPCSENCNAGCPCEDSCQDGLSCQEDVWECSTTCACINGSQEMQMVSSNIFEY